MGASETPRSSTLNVSIFPTATTTVQRRLPNLELTNERIEIQFFVDLWRSHY